MRNHKDNWHKTSIKSNDISMKLKGLHGLLFNWMNNINKSSPISWVKMG